MASSFLGFVSKVSNAVAGTVVREVSSHNIPLPSIPTPSIPHINVPSGVIPVMAVGGTKRREDASPEQLQWHVPRGLDLHYITERIMAMSQPTSMAPPRQAAKTHTEAPAPAQEKPVVVEDEGDVSAPQTQENAVEEEGDKLPSTPAAQDTRETSDRNQLDKKPPQSMEERPPPQSLAPESETLSKRTPPSKADRPPRPPSSRKTPPTTKTGNTGSCIGSKDNSTSSSSSRKRPRRGNCPGKLSTFLSRRHNSRFLTINVSDSDADDRTLLLLNQQIIRFNWTSPGITKSQTPTTPHILDICYAIHAYLSLSDDTVVLVYCSNGKTRTGIVVACYLKYAGLVRTAMDGFRVFCSRRCHDDFAIIEHERNVAEQIPPSLRTFFRNFDDCVELKGYPNPEPLILRAVALQGVPVDDMPRLDIWDGQQRHIYSSHQSLDSDGGSGGKEIMTGGAMGESSSEGGGEGIRGGIAEETRNRTSCPIEATTSQWADEEGFYRVNQLLLGDFVLLCRFGGPYAEDTDDPTKVLFRYANSSGFLFPGPYELPKIKVDMMRRYADSFDDEDFLLTFMIDSVDETTEEGRELLNQSVKLSTERSIVGRNDADEERYWLPLVFEGQDAIDRGLRIIAETHACSPSNEGSKALLGDAVANNHVLSDLASLALQFSNNDVEMAREKLGGRMRHLWECRYREFSENASDGKQGGFEITSDTQQCEDDMNDTMDEPSASTHRPLHVVSDESSEEEERRNFLELLDNIDLGVNIGWMDGDDDAKVISTPKTEERLNIMDGQGSAANKRSKMTSAMLYQPLVTPARGDILDAFGNRGRFEEIETSDNDRVDMRETLAQCTRPSLPLHRRKRRRRRYGNGRSHKRPHTRKDGLANAERALLDSLRNAATVALDLLHQGEEEYDGCKREPVQFISHCDVPASYRMQTDDDEEAAMALDMLLQISHTGVKAQDLIKLKDDSITWHEDGLSRVGTEENHISRHEMKQENVPKSAESTEEKQNESKSDLKAAASTTAQQGKKERQMRPVAVLPVAGGEVASLTARWQKSGGPLSLEGEAAAAAVPSRHASGVASFSVGKRADGSLASVFTSQGSGGARPPPSAATAAAMAAIAKRRSGGSSAVTGEGNEIDAKGDGNAAVASCQTVESEPSVKSCAAASPAASLGKRSESSVEQKNPEEKPKTSGGERPSLKDDPEYRKYFQMLKVGLPMGAVKNAVQRDGKDPDVMDGDHSKPAAVAPPLREEPEYVKYFNMIKIGLPMDAVKHALKRDGKNPAIMELDPNKPLKLQKIPEQDEEEKNSDDEEEEEEKKDDGKSRSDTEEPPLKDDPEYEKYFRMLKMGLPMGAVKNALQRDGKDPNVMDLDHDKSVKSQMKKKDDDDGPPLKEDPEYAKYFKMLKMGLPIGAVKNALQRDGKDPNVMDLDHDKSVKSQIKKEEEEYDGPSLKEDPEYAKYFKMLKMGLPMGAVKNALQRDGKDPSIMDLDHDKSVKSQTKKEKEEDDGPPLKEDPEYAKYFKMLKMGLPMGAVKNALQRDGKDPSIMDLDPEKSVKSQLNKEEEEDDGPPLKEDPEYEKYFKMLKMGLPMGAVKNALQRDGKDPSIMDLDHSKSVKSQLNKEEEEDTGVPLKDDPEYAKYFKMLKMGLPMGAVKNALQRDGKDPGIMDLDPEKSVAWQLNAKSKKNSKKSGKKKKERKLKVRRKKIFWNPIDESKINAGSIWSLVQGSVNMDKLKYDPSEFESLFTDTSDPNEKKKKAGDSGGEAASKPKKSVQVIDGKRGMNGGIILARLKMEFDALARMVDYMDSGHLDATQLRALKEFLPTDEEKAALKQYLEAASSSEERKQAAMEDLCPCEKYMVAMMKVENATGKFDCMLFKAQFLPRLDELLEQTETMIKACDELQTSDKVRKLFAMILTLGNQINTGGSGNLAAGFSLDALLKLDEAKAFDKKTSVLQYLVKLVRQNDESLINIKDDIPSVAPAENIILESLLGDMKQMNEELGHVVTIASQEADRIVGTDTDVAFERKMSLTELSEQRTYIRQIEGVCHYNRAEYRNGRTPMEKFTIEAEQAVKSMFSRAKKLENKYAKLLEYFGEDEKMPSQEFFGTINKFLVAFDAANDIVDKLEKAKLKEEKRAAAQKAKEEKKLAAKLAKEAQKEMASKKLAAADSDKSIAVGVGNVTEDDGKETGLPSGAASLAAVLARRKRAMNPKEVQDDGNEKGPQQTGNVGQPQQNSNLAKFFPKTDPLSKTMPGRNGNGTAEIAAAAAKQRTSEKGGMGTTVLPQGGIAAAAAAAAFSKHNGNERDSQRGKASDAEARFQASKGGSCDEGESETTTETAHEALDKAQRTDLVKGGIAVAAAAAAQARQKKNKTESSQETKVDMAKAGSTRRNRLNGEELSNGSKGGVAAMAAAAARQRKTTRNDLETTATPVAGIEAAVSAAAHAKHVESEKRSLQPDSKTDKGAASMEGRLEDPKRESLDETRCEVSSDDTTKGGISAAAAALARHKKETTDSSEESGNKVDTSFESTKQRKETDAAEEEDLNNESKDGVAALAATVAGRGRAGQNDEKPAAKTARGRAAAAAEAALSRRSEGASKARQRGMLPASAMKKVESRMKRGKSESSPGNKGRFASDTVQAGRRQSTVSVKGTGGTAAAAKAKARQKKEEKTKCSPQKSRGGANVSYSAAKKRAIKAERCLGNENKRPVIGEGKKQQKETKLPQERNGRRETFRSAFVDKQPVDEAKTGKEDSNNIEAGIAAMATGGAGQQRVETNAEEATGQPTGGIAAAAAALAKQKERARNETKQDESEAAAVQMEVRQESEENEFSLKSKGRVVAKMSPSPPMSPRRGEAIGAVSATPAPAGKESIGVASKTNAEIEQQLDKDEYERSGATFPAFRERERSDNGVESPSFEEKQEGGLAVAAAAAARAKQAAAARKTQDSGERKDGGVAAAAATAALARARKRTSSSGQTPSAGIAAAAAAAARRRNDSSASSDAADTSPPTVRAVN